MRCICSFIINVVYRNVYLVLLWVFLKSVLSGSEKASTLKLGDWSWQNFCPFLRISISTFLQVGKEESACAWGGTPISRGLLVWQKHLDQRVLSNKIGNQNTNSFFILQICLRSGRDEETVTDTFCPSPIPSPFNKRGGKISQVF